jgi:hypothetical protein
MFKFGTIGAFKHARNNPRLKAAAQLKNGFVVIPDEANGTCAAPAAQADAQSRNVWVVYNIIDKPEVLSTKDFTIEAGEYVRQFLLADLEGLPVELNEDVVNTAYASVSVGDVLVPDHDGSGKWVKADGVTYDEATYAIALEVLEKTTFGGNGLYCQVKVK